MVTRVKQRGIRVTTKNRDREQSGVLSPEILNGSGGSAKTGQNEAEANKVFLTYIQFLPVFVR